MCPLTEDQRVYKCWDATKEVKGESHTTTVTRERRGEAASSSAGPAHPDEIMPNESQATDTVNPKPKPKPKPKAKAKSVGQQAKAVALTHLMIISLGYPLK